jgi:hypothetical protein
VRDEARGRIEGEIVAFILLVERVRRQFDA